MAENKKGFILYCDLIHMIEQLPNDKAGELFKHILRYVNDQNPVTDDLITNITFEPIKQQLKRDLKQWEDSISVKSISGKLGNLKRWNIDLYNQVLAKTISIEDAEIIANSRKVSHTDNLPSHPIAKIAVTDTVTDTVTEEIKHSVFDFDSFWKMYAKSSDKEKCKKAYAKISESERSDIKIKLPLYIDTIKDKKYQKNPLTYLNGKCWNDIEDVPAETFNYSKPSANNGVIRF